MKKVQLHQRGQRPEAQKGCRSRRGRIPATAACTDGRASAHRYWSDLELRNRGHAIHGLLTPLSDTTGTAIRCNPGQTGEEKTP